ncbi:PH domain-containing protein, putative [Plasmodium ovale]|nr:PH domain-containing protein, putative [Plasmodium ovale]
MLLSTSAPIFFNRNIDKWTRELLKVSKNEYSNSKEISLLTDRKYCGQSLNHMAGLVLEKSDKEAKLIIEGSIIYNKLILKLGNIKEKEINIQDIILPVETLSNKCINIRQVKSADDSTILCLASKVLRNFWINSITDAVLCKLTKSMGKLPEFNYALEEGETGSENKDEETDVEGDGKENGESNREDEEKMDEKTDGKTDGKYEDGEKRKKKEQIRNKLISEEFDDERENEQRGLKLRIAKSKFGQPNIKINGKNVQDLKKEGSEKEEKNTENRKNIEPVETMENEDSDTDVDSED